MSDPIYIHASNCITPLGFSLDETFEAVLAGKSGIERHENTDLLPIPFVASIFKQAAISEVAQRFNVPNTFTKLEQLLTLALLPIVAQFPVTEQSLLILSTTKGNIDFIKDPSLGIEAAQLGTLAQKMADYFGFKKKPIVLSNACVSGVMALQVAKNMLQANYCDSVYCIAGDQVTEFVLSGFNSFQAMSFEPCQPYDEARKGVNLGEATAAMYLNKKPGQFQLVSAASINDANHISGPSRTGEGLYQSIQNTLKHAQVNAEEVDFISAHGTATLYNDEMESIAFQRANLLEKPINSMKGYFGHTLGASGLVETVLSIKSAQTNTLIPSLGFNKMGVSQPINIIQSPTKANINYFVKTASGFGGTNAALLIKKTDHGNV